MITYSFVYESETRPKILKNMTATSGEVFTVEVFFTSEEDKKIFTAEQVYEHLENLLQYIKDKTPNLSLIHMDEQNDGDGWHLNGGWAEIDWANTEILKWWDFAYYNELPLSSQE